MPQYSRGGHWPPFGILQNINVDNARNTISWFRDNPVWLSAQYIALLVFFIYFLKLVTMGSVLAVNKPHNMRILTINYIKQLKIQNATTS